MIVQVIAAALAGVIVGLVIGAVAVFLAIRGIHAAELERFGNMLTVGTPRVDDPEIVSPPPDAVGRARARIHEDRVQNGIAMLQDRYRERGLSITDEEARIQVEAMLMGNSPVPS